MRSKVSEFERGFVPKTLLNRAAPLFDVLRRRLGFEGSKTNSRYAKYRWPKVEVSGNDSRCGNEIITLLCFRKNIWNVVTLVAPRVHVYRRKEKTKGCV